MEKMRNMDIQKAVKEAVFNRIVECFKEDGEQFGDFEIAIPVTVEGVERWGKISVVCGQLNDSKTSKAFDPFIAQAEWKEEKEYKEKLKREKEEIKAKRKNQSKKE